MASGEILVGKDPLRYLLARADFGAMEFEVCDVGMQMTAADDADENPPEYAFTVVERHSYLVLIVFAFLKLHLHFRVSNGFYVVLLLPIGLYGETVCEVFLYDIQWFMDATFGVFDPENFDWLLLIQPAGFIGI